MKKLILTFFPAVCVNPALTRGALRTRGAQKQIPTSTMNWNVTKRWAERLTMAAIVLGLAFLICGFGVWIGAALGQEWRWWAIRVGSCALLLLVCLLFAELLHHRRHRAADPGGPGPRSQLPARTCFLSGAGR